MKPFFQTTEKQAALWAEAQRWIGTPFFPRAASVGHGVDCVNLQHEKLVAVGGIPRLALPAYTLDRAKHSTRSQLLQFLLTTPELAGRFVLVPHTAPRLPGDLLGLKSGHTDHHLAMQHLWGKVVHAVEDKGVIETPANDREIVARTLYVLRLMEVVS